MPQEKPTYEELREENQELKNQLRSLQAKEKLSRITFNSIGDAVITTDSKGRVIRMNPVAEKLTGWAAKEAQNQPLEKVFHIVNAQSGEKVDNPVEKVLREGKGVALANHTKLISRNNKEYHIADTAAPIREDQNVITGVVLVFRDVTKQYILQENLKASEEKYRTVFENTGTATTFLEKDGTISLANKEFAKLSGYSIDEIENKKTWMEFVVPEDLAWMKEQHEMRRQKNDAALNEYEFRFIDKDKNLKYIHLYIDIIPETGKSVASLLDITHKVKNEQQLKEKIEDLEKFNKLMVGRENRMIELKREVNHLLKESGRDEKYTTPDKKEDED